MGVALETFIKLAGHDCMLDMPLPTDIIGVSGAAAYRVAYHIYHASLESSI